MRTILIVDDNKDIRELVRRGLELEGFAVLEAENGQAAQLVLNGPVKPGLVLLDLMMPVMDGREFLQWKNLQSEFVEIKVVVISAMIYDRSLLRGVTDVLRKPIDLDNLLELAEQYCA